MIKRIQLRGISRTPSDRMTDDGGCAESLNVFLTDGENAPAQPPVDIRDELGLPVHEENRMKAVYIHKVGSKSNYIYVEWLGTEQDHQAILCYPGGQHIASTMDDEYILEDTVTSLGNTLIFSTTRGKGYAIYRDGKYAYLGREIPQLKLDIRPNCYQESMAASIVLRKDKTEPDSDLYKADSTEWKKELSLEESHHSEEYSDINNKFWEEAQPLLLDSIYFRYPVFVRFAIKLYGGDESYVHHTVPVFLSGGFKRLFAAELKYQVQANTTGSQGRGTYYTTVANISQDGPAYKIFSQLLNAEDFDNWKDIVQSIDMFISGPVLYPEINSKIVACGDYVTSSDGNTKTLAVRFQDDIGSVDEENNLKDALLNGSRLFYKVRSFSIDNLQELVEGTETKNSKQLSFMENLATKDSLVDDFRTNNEYASTRNYIMNHRLMSIGITETFGRGMRSLYGLRPTTVFTEPATSVGTETHKSYDFVYEIKDNDGTMKYVHAAETMETATLMNKERGYGGRPVRLPVGGVVTEKWYNSDVSQILFYPDTRCRAVYVINEEGGAVRLPMYAHPYLSCAYYIGDISKTLSDLEYSDDLTIPDEDRMGNSYSTTYLFLSALENPFYFPASGRLRFSANIISVAGISTALSEGQYGQFDLYVFTDDGIWTLKPNDQGVYLETKPLTRDVCISSNAVVSIDQAVVFVTAKGVMLLDGSRITNLSPDMNGRHYSIEDAAMAVVETVGLGHLERVLEDKTPFMRFMTDETKGRLQIGYDYTGGRLIFFNEGYKYEYIYMLESGTWHKHTSVENDMQECKMLNSYPECSLFGVDGQEEQHLFNFSTVLDVLDEKTEVDCIIATRPFDLGAPDMLKTISNIRIRGQYDKHLYKEEVIRTESYLKIDYYADMRTSEDVAEILRDYNLDVKDVEAFMGGEEQIDVTGRSAQELESLLMDLDGQQVIGSIVERDVTAMVDTGKPRVKYILLGSQDGIHFTRLGTLRGKSWKLFRMIVLATLRPNERISWIDVEYDPRFTNRLR